MIRIHGKDKKQNNRLNNVGLELQRLTLIFIWLQVRCPNSQLLLDFMVTNGLLSFQPLYFTIPTFTFKHNGTICFWIVQSVSELKFSLIPTFMQTAKEFFFSIRSSTKNIFVFMFAMWLCDNIFGFINAFRTFLWNYFCQENTGQGLPLHYYKVTTYGVLLLCM